MDLDRAKAICKVADSLIDSARVEVKFLEVTDRTAELDFFDETRKAPPASPEFENLKPRRQRLA